jgi:hypothetical protein
MNKLSASRAILAEFVGDVEAAGPESTEVDWPDLYVTYLKAKKYLGEV